MRESDRTVVYLASMEPGFVIFSPNGKGYSGMHELMMDNVLNFWTYVKLEHRQIFPFPSVHFCVTWPNPVYHQTVPTQLWDSWNVLTKLNPTQPSPAQPKPTEPNTNQYTPIPFNKVKWKMQVSAIPTLAAQPDRFYFWEADSLTVRTLWYFDCEAQIHIHAHSAPCRNGEGRDSLTKHSDQRSFDKEYIQLIPPPWMSEKRSYLGCSFKMLFKSVILILHSN